MKLNVKGMNCKHCQANVKQALKSLGLKRIKVDLKKSTVSFKENKDVSINQVVELIKQAGYEVI